MLIFFRRTSSRRVAFGLLALWLGHPCLSQAQPAACKVLTPSLEGSYEGECRAGLANGRGRAAGKDRYEGYFRDGRPGGVGTYTASDGRQIEGEFAAGQPHGRAKWTAINGDVLEGEFREGKLIGVGKLTRRDGQVTAVELVEGKLKPAGESARSDMAASPTPAPQPATLANSTWKPLIQLDEIFPSLLMATVTRPAPSSNPAIRGDPAAQIGIEIQTSRPNTKVETTIAVDELAEPTAETFLLQAPGTYRLFPKLRWKYSALRKLSQDTPANVSWAVSIDGQAQPPVLRPVRIRSVYDAPLGVSENGQFTNLSWVFVAYVNEQHPWIDRLLKETLASGTVKAFVGYQAGAAAADAQVAALYDALQRRGIKYSSVTTTATRNPRVPSQRVRFLEDSVGNSQANCIDGSVLFASLLRAIGLDAFIILGPGHAMVGYYNGGPKRGDFRVIETTLVGVAPFSDALRRGSSKYEQWRTQETNNPSFKIVSVTHARDLGIVPIGR